VLEEHPGDHRSDEGQPTRAARGCCDQSGPRTKAAEALQTELEIGVMLPCNVIVYEADDGATVVTAIDPTLTIGDRYRSLGALAERVRDKLGRALARLE